MPKVIMRGKLCQRCAHLLYCSVLSLGGNVNKRQMSQPRENWFQYVRRVYATAINFPCIITLRIYESISDVYFFNEYLKIKSPILNNLRYFYCKILIFQGKTSQFYQFQIFSTKKAANDNESF